MADIGRSATREVSPWATGFAIFASVLMIMLGVLHAIMGLVALIDDEFYVTTATGTSGDVQQYTFEFDLTSWGWIHLIAGIVIAFAGFALVSGQVWARGIGIALAALSAIANFMWLPYYPIWSVVAIGLAVGVIWGLARYSPESV